MHLLLDRETGRAPDGSDLSDDDLRSLYDVPRTPWLRVNFVSTVDGAAQGSDGRSGGINNEADGRVFHLLRGSAGAVVVGAGTARTEGYGPFDKPLVLVSRRGEVPERLQGARPGAVLLATCAASPGLAAARDLLGEDHVVVAGDDEVDLAAMVAALHGRGLRLLHSEGGPHLFGDLLAAGLVDELCHTLVPRLVAGDHLRLAAGPDLDATLDLRVLLEQDGTLLGRWFVRPS